MNPDAWTAVDSIGFYTLDIKVLSPDMFVQCVGTLKICSEKFLEEQTSWPLTSTYCCQSVNHPHAHAHMCTQIILFK